MTGPISVRSYIGREGLAELSGVWSAVVSCMAAHAVFQTAGWQQGYMEFLAPDGACVQFLVALVGDVPAGIFPFVYGSTTVCGVPLRSWSLPAHPHLPLDDFVCVDGTDPVALWPHVVDHLRHDAERPFDVIRVTNALEHSLALHCLTDTAVTQLNGGCSYLPCEPGTRAVDRLSKNFKAVLRKGRNKLALLEGVEFLSTREPRLLGDYFERFLEVEASGWKGAAGTGTAIALNPRLRAFYRHLLDTFAATGDCEISLLNAEGRCLAAQFCLIGGGVVYVLKIGYDESYARVAPGQLVLEHLVDRCCTDATITAVNLVSDADWHKTWHPQSYRTWNAHVFGRSLRGQAAGLLLRARQTAVRSSSQVKALLAG